MGMVVTLPPQLLMVSSAERVAVSISMAGEIEKKLY